MAEVQRNENCFLVDLIALKQIQQQKNNTNTNLRQTISKLQMLFGKDPY